MWLHGYMQSAGMASSYPYSNREYLQVVNIRVGARAARNYIFMEPELYIYVASATYKSVRFGFNSTVTIL
jgi:hypothetical protein